MSFNGSGSFVLNSGGLPFVTGTVISSTTANNLNTDLASGLSTCITKDGQTTVTANLPMSTFRHTNVGAATARTDYARASQVQDSTLLLIGTVAGTNTITGNLSPAITAYAVGQAYQFTPANTNTGATTISINSVGARNIFWNGAACVGGELRQNIPARIVDDGTQFNIVGNGFNAPFLDTHPVVEGSADTTKKVRLEVDGLTTATTRVLTVQDQDMTIGTVLGTPQASTSGASIDFTSIPPWAKTIQISFVGVSTNGTSDYIVQLGDSGGVETSGYLGAGNTISGASTATTNYTAGFGVVRGPGATGVYHGTITLTLENASTFTWTCTSIISNSASAEIFFNAGSKSTSAALDRVRITTAGGTDAFDAGAINILYG